MKLRIARTRLAALATAACLTLGLTAAAATAPAANAQTFHAAQAVGSHPAPSKPKGNSPGGGSNNTGSNNNPPAATKPQGTKPSHGSQPPANTGSQVTNGGSKTKVKASSTAKAGIPGYPASAPRVSKVPVRTGSLVSHGSVTKLAASKPTLSKGTRARGNSYTFNGVTFVNHPATYWDGIYAGYATTGGYPVRYSEAWDDLVYSPWYAPNYTYRYSPWYHMSYPVGYTLSYYGFAPIVPVAHHGGGIAGWVIVLICVLAVFMVTALVIALRRPSRRNSNY